jgi:hypothetical protein
MTATIILVFSCIALLQFFVSYCRSIIAASTAHPVSEQVREVAGIAGRDIQGEEFIRLLQLANLCPASTGDHSAIAAVRTYFRMVTFVQLALRRIIPGTVSSWAESELSKCAHFAAVALDHRITTSRDLMAQQISGNS